MNKSNNIVIGKLGEEKAKNYLIEKGYKILCINYKCKIGEIDLIAKDNDTIVFVEVKTRSSDAFGMPREAVNYRKQNKIRLVAQVYLKANKFYSKSCRFDVIDILKDKITHIENCF